MERDGDGVLALRRREMVVGSLVFFDDDDDKHSFFSIDYLCAYVYVSYCLFCSLFVKLLASSF